MRLALAARLRPSLTRSTRRALSTHKHIDPTNPVLVVPQTYSKDPAALVTIETTARASRPHLRIVCDWLLRPEEERTTSRFPPSEEEDCITVYLPRNFPHLKLVTHHGTVSFLGDVFETEGGVQVATEEGGIDFQSSKFRCEKLQAVSKKNGGSIRSSQGSKIDAFGPVSLEAATLRLANLASGSAVRLAAREEMEVKFVFSPVIETTSGLNSDLGSLHASSYVSCVSTRGNLRVGSVDGFAERVLAEARTGAVELTSMIQHSRHRRLMVAGKKNVDVTLGTDVAKGSIVATGSNVESKIAGFPLEAAGPEAAVRVECLEGQGRLVVAEDSTSAWIKGLNIKM